MVDALCQEIVMRQDFLADDVETIYFGGGTPSLLSGDDLRRIIDTAAAHHTIKSDVELTIEANPEDLNGEYLQEIKQIGVNRLSIGIQSFLQSDLDLMNRAHNVEQSHAAIKQAQDAGIHNISIDLMFGLVSSDLDAWLTNVQQAIDHKPYHISCYNLTIEEQTAYAHWIKKEKIALPHEDVQYEQFLKAHEILTNHGYDHYEISNYARPGHVSRHNTSYWERSAYLGIGPAAHSYRDGTRLWNVSDNQRYVKSINNGIIPSQSEQLSETDQYNEFVMLSLRKKQGVSRLDLSQLSPHLQDHFLATANNLKAENRILNDNDRWYLPVSMWYQSDAISAELFYDD